MITTPEVLTTETTITAVIHLNIPARDMGRYMDPAIQEVLKTLAEQGIAPVGRLFSYHHRRPTDTFDFELGFPVGRPIIPAGRVMNGTLPGRKVVRAVHRGPYEDLAGSWRALQDWVREHEYREDGRFWECYLNNPNEVGSPEEYRTELNWVIG